MVSSACGTTFVFAQWWDFETLHCPTRPNEDSTLNLHITPPLRKHFVVPRARLGGTLNYTDGQMKLIFI